MTTLTLAIAAYKAGIADFNANAPWGADEAADAYAAISYLPPLEALRAFSGPAESRAAAELALRTAVEEIEIGDIETAEALVRAALGWVEVPAHG